MLTKEMLMELPDHAIIAAGTTVNSPDGVYMTDYRKGDFMTWVAIRGGGYYDWAIYIGWMETPIERIITNGDKITSKRFIKKLVEADEEAMALYRL